MLSWTIPWVPSSSKLLHSEGCPSLVLCLPAPTLNLGKGRVVWGGSEGTEITSMSSRLAEEITWGNTQIMVGTGIVVPPVGEHLQGYSLQAEPGGKYP